MRLDCSAFVYARCGAATIAVADRVSGRRRPLVFDTTEILQAGNPEKVCASYTHQPLPTLVAEWGQAIQAIDLKVGQRYRDEQKTPTAAAVKAGAPKDAWASLRYRERMPRGVVTRPMPSIDDGDAAEAIGRAFGKSADRSPRQSGGGRHLVSN